MKIYVVAVILVAAASAAHAASETITVNSISHSPDRSPRC
jgi:hypothetical protein